MSIIARLGVVLGINTAEFKQGLDEAIKKSRATELEFKESAKRQKKSAEDMADAFSKIGLAAAAAGVAIVNTMKRAADITDVSEGFDITVESLLATEKALMLAAGKAEDLGSVLNKLAQAQDAAKEGNDTMRESFERLGVSAGAVENQKLDRLFLDVATALSKIDDTSKRAALAQDLLGKSVKGVNWSEFVKQYKQFSDPALVKAIEQNDKAWENIEISLKNISNLMLKIVGPMAEFANKTFEASENLKKIENFNMLSIAQFLFASKTVDLGSRKKPSGDVDIFSALPPEDSETPMLFGDLGTYAKKSAKELAAQKGAKDTRNALIEEISLLKKKYDIAQKMFEVDLKGISLGADAIAEEKMLLDLANDLAEIRSNATKERKKENAAIDLINAKEKEQVNARVAQFGFENGLRIQQTKRQHELTMRAIQDEGMAKHDAMSIEIFNALNVLDIEADKFKLGFDAYELAKLQNEQNEKLRLIHFQSYAALQKINREYELSAKSAEDLQLYEEKLNQLRYDNIRQITFTSTIEERKQEILKNQLDLNKQIFALDIAQQKGRDIANIQATLNVERQRAQLEAARYLMSTNQYNLSNLALENVNRLIEAEKKYNDQMKEAEYEMQRQGGGQRAREEYEQRIKAIKEVMDIELDAIGQINDARQANLEKEIERQRSFVSGWEYAAKQFQENSENAFKRGEAAFSFVMNSMDKAISDFVETGKFKFEEFAYGIIKELIRMEAQAQASILFRSIVGMFSPAPIKTMNYDAGIGASVGFAAAGGAINGPTIVGENGPELFMPNTPGTVIPNGSWQQAAASMGGSGFTNNGTYIANMSAIDTQSATQFLASNKNTIWAAYQSANRSIPISR